MNSAAPRTGDRSYLRRRNSLAVLEHIWLAPSTVSDIARATSLSRTAAESVLGDLVDSGWAFDGGPQNERTVTPGRPASLYHFARGVGYVAGVDVGAHHVSAGIADLAGERVATVRVAVDESLPAQDRVQVARHTLEQALAKAHVNQKETWALIVGSPGVIDQGRVVHFGGDGMPGWIGLDIASEFSHFTDASVLVGGDSALGALAEMTHGAALGASDMVYLLSGVRTGSAIAIDGVLRRGYRGGAGLVGELPELRWRDLEHERYGQASFSAPRPDRLEIFARAERGEAEALEAVADFADVLALGAAAMVLAINPEIVVIGGPNAQFAHLFLDHFVERLAARCPIVPDVMASSLGQDAVLAGSIQMGLDEIHRTLRDGIESHHSFPSPRASLIRGR